jgi:hypothetical protein
MPLAVLSAAHTHAFPPGKKFEPPRCSASHPPRSITTRVNFYVPRSTTSPAATGRCRRATVKFTMVGVDSTPL